MKEYTSYNYLHADLTTPIFYYSFALGWGSQKPFYFELNIIWASIYNIALLCVHAHNDFEKQFLRFLQRMTFDFASLGNAVTRVHGRAWSNVPQVLK